MSSNNSQEPLQPFSPALNDLIRESVREHLARQRRNIDARRLALQYVAKCLEIGVAPAHNRMAQLERWDVRLAHDLVICIHLPSESYIYMATVC